MKKGILFSLVLSIVLSISSPAFAAENVTRSEAEMPQDTQSVTVSHEANGLELPIEGATGYALVELNVYTKANGTKPFTTIPAGTPFLVHKEDGKRWYVEWSDGNGWVSHLLCMVNLPDVVPSVVYNATNSYDSMYMSMGHELEGVTHQSLYTGKTMNERLGYEEYMMPALYATAKKIAAAQAAALAEGNTLVIYEAYRPMEVQKAVRTALNKLYDNFSDVHAGINDGTWGKSWFISQGTSNHQRGAAMDVSLAKVVETTNINVDGHSVVYVSRYAEYKMPTEMHELSVKAVTFAWPVSGSDGTSWRKVPLAGSFTDGAKLLQKYCTDAGMTPLASEWWHFDDWTALNSTNKAGKGNFKIEITLSTVPSMA